MTSCNRYYQSPKSRCQRKLLYYGADSACKLSSNNLSEKDKGERLLKDVRISSFFLPQKLHFHFFIQERIADFFENDLNEICSHLGTFE